MQAFEGTVIARHNTGMGETITVRKVSFGQGVERIFPLHAPVVDHIDVVRTGRVRRAKLYYLRGLKGKAARLRERDLNPFRSRCPPAATSEPLRRAGFRRHCRRRRSRARRLVRSRCSRPRWCWIRTVPSAVWTTASNSRRSGGEVLAARIRERARSLGRGRGGRVRDRPLEYSRSRAAGHAARGGTALPGSCDHLLVDAIRIDLPLPQTPLIHGDALCFSIAAASILAKVERDRLLTAWDQVFPEYGLAHNKGYGTPDHVAALRRLGPTTLHRFSFEPVRNCSRLEVWTGYPIPIGQIPLQQGELFA